MASSIVQEKISPHQILRPSDSLNSQNSGANLNIDFKSLIVNSNEEVKKKSEKSQDLSSSKNYHEFIDKLRTKKEEEKLPNNQLGKDEFLKLFIAQIQNQDPLSPKDSSEMASQLAQFNGLEQMINVNSTLERMEKASSDQKFYDYIHLIDKSALIQDSKVFLKNAQLDNAVVNFPKNEDNILLEILDQNKEIVFRKDFQSIPAGDLLLKWDGVSPTANQLPDGMYDLKFYKISKNGEKSDVEFYTKSKIKGVGFGTTSKLFTESGEVSFSDIKAIQSQNQVVQKTNNSQNPSEFQNSEPENGIGNVGDSVPEK